MAYGMRDTLTQYLEKARLGTLDNTTRTGQFTWSPKDVMKIEQTYKPNMFPQDAEESSLMPEGYSEPYTLTDKLKASMPNIDIGSSFNDIKELGSKAYNVAKAIPTKGGLLSILGAVPELIGKPIARGLRTITGADEGLTPEQLQRQYGQQRLLGREPTPEEQTLYNLSQLGTTLALSRGMTSLPKIAAAGGVGAGLSSYGTGQSIPEVGERAMEGAIYAPAVSLGTGAASRVLPKTFLGGGLSEVIGGLTGTRAIATTREAQGKPLPTAEDYISSGLINLILGRSSSFLKDRISPERPTPDWVKTWNKDKGNIYETQTQTGILPKLAANAEPVIQPASRRLAEDTIFPDWINQKSKFTPQPDVPQDLATQGSQGVSKWMNLEQMLGNRQIPETTPSRVPFEMPRSSIEPFEMPRSSREAIGMPRSSRDAINLPASLKPTAQDNLYSYINREYRTQDPAKMELIRNIADIESTGSYIDHAGLNNMLSKLVNTKIRLSPNEIPDLVKSYSDMPTKLGSFDLFAKVNDNVTQNGLMKLRKDVNAIVSAEIMGEGLHLDTVKLTNDILNSKRQITDKEIGKLIEDNIIIDPTKSGTTMELPEEVKAFENTYHNALKNKVIETIDKLKYDKKKREIMTNYSDFNIKSLGEEDPTDFAYKVRKFQQEQLDSNWSLFKVSDIARDPYLKALSYNKNMNNIIADRIIFDNAVDLNGNVTGRSLASVFKGVTPKQFDNFLQYQLHKHNIDRYRQGTPIDSTITPDMSASKIKTIESIDPSVKEISKRWNQFSSTLMHSLMVKENIITPDDFSKMLFENPDYISTARTGFATPANVLKKATGSKGDRDLQNGVEIIVDSVRKFVNAASKQRLYTRLYKTVENNPNMLSDFVEIVPVPMNKTKPMTVQGLEDYVDQLTRIRNPNDLQEGRIKYIVIDGDLKAMRIKDDLLFNALEPLPANIQNAVINFVGQMTRNSKLLITQYNPLFGLANLTRDIPVGYINSKTQDNFGKYLLEYAGAMADIITNKPIYQLYQNLGGAGQLRQRSGLPAGKRAADVVNQLVEKEGFPNDIKKIANHIAEMIKYVPDASEVSSRLAEFKRGIQLYGDTPRGRQLALHNGNELTVNFFKKGSSESANIIDSFYPYYNASLQGLTNLKDMLLKEGLETKGLPEERQLASGTGQSLDYPKESSAKQETQRANRFGYPNPKTWGKAALILTLPSILSALLLHDDPDYQRLDSQTKDDNLILPFKNKDKTFKKIPLSKEIAVPFHVIPTRIIESVLRANPRIFYEDLMDTIIRNFSPIDPFGGNIIAPIYRTYGSPEGRDWLGRPILNQKDLTLEPRLQFNENTSAPAIKLGDIFNLSPKKLDAIAGSYTGILSQLIKPATSQSGSWIAPITRRFTADPLYQTDIINDHYDRVKKLTVKINTAKSLNDPRNVNDVKTLKRLERISDQMSLLRNMKTKISTDKPLSTRDLQIIKNYTKTDISSMAKPEQLRALQQGIVDLADISAKTP